MKINIFIQSMAKTHAHKIAHTCMSTRTHRGLHAHNANKEHMHTGSHTHARMSEKDMVSVL